MATVQQIYIAIFGRPADPVGLAYWNEQTNNGADLSAMIAAFTAAPEYEARFEGQSNEEIISSIYQSLFGREPDDEGLEFYAEALANGELPIETIAVRILDGAQNEDQTSIENKTEAADKFTASIDTPEEIEAYQGTQAATEAQEFLETVNEDPESVPSDEEVDQAVKEVNEGDYNPPEEEPEVPGGPGGDGNGVVRALTSGNDTISTGSGDDIINASAKNSLNIGDDIDGGDGDDELNISAGAIADYDYTTSSDFIAYAPAGGPTISNVEVINNSDVDGLAFPELDLTNVKGLDELWTDFSDVEWTPDANGSDSTNTIGARYSGNTSPDTVFGISNVAEQVANNDDDNMAGRATLSFNGGTGPLKLALSGNAVGSYYAAGAADSFTNINIDAFAGNSGTIAVSDTATSIEVTGAGDLAFLERAFDDLENFNASGASGDIDFAASSLAAEAKLVGGGGQDTLSLSTVGDAGPSIEVIDFEVINLLRSGTIDTAVALDADIFEGAEVIRQLEKASDVVNIGESTTVGFGETTNTGGGAGGPVIDLQFTGATGSIELDNVADGSAFGIVGPSLTTLNISGSVADDDDSDSLGQLQLWTEIGNQPEFETVNLSMSSDTDLALYEPIPDGSIEDNSFFGATTFNGEGSTGGLVITPAGIPVTDFIAWETFSTGSGNDTVSVDLASFSAEAVSLSLGMGDDDFTLNADGDGGTNANLTIDLGEGNDTLRFTDDGIANVELPGEDVISGRIIVDGFGEGDTLEFEDTFAATEVTITPDGNTSLVDAVNAAIAADTAESENIVFDFDGSSYLYIDNNSEAQDFASGDGLIEFAGTNPSDLGFVGIE